MMTRADRLQWLHDFFKGTIRTSRQKIGDGPWHDKRSSDFLSALDADFVNRYIDATGATYRPMMIGADRCAMLAADLKALHDAGILSRHSTGISGMGPGWPRWVWLYSLTNP